MRETIQEVEKLCPQCKGKLLVRIKTHDVDDQDFSEQFVFCPQCNWGYDSKEHAGELGSRGLGPEVLMNIIVKPPLDYLRHLPDHYRTDLTKIPETNRPWAHIVGQIISVGSNALSPGSYRVIIYTLLTPCAYDESGHFWILEKNGDSEAFEFSGLSLIKIGKPLIRPDKNGVWKAVVDVGYAYFILVIVCGDRQPGFRISDNGSLSRLPLRSLDGVVLTHWVITKEVFHPGNR